GVLRSKPQTPRAGRWREGGLAVQDRWTAVFSGIAVPLRCREMPKPAGPNGPRRPARPRISFGSPTTHPPPRANAPAGTGCRLAIESGKPHGGQAKSPAKRAGLCLRNATLLNGPPLLRRRNLRHVGLERLVGLLGEVGIDLTDLGRLGDEALVGRLGVA